MAQFADELLAIVSTYIEPDVSGSKVMYMQMAGSVAWNQLSSTAYANNPGAIFKNDPNYSSYEAIFFQNTVSPTQEDFYKTWCDLYYQYSGDASLREE